MNKEELYIGGVKVPLSGSINASITKSISDIREPDKVKSDYSKTITLPSSKELSQIFNFIFEINIDGTFNANKKADALYTFDNIAILKGYIQLKSIEIIDEFDISYNCVLFGETADLFTSLGIKELTDIEGLDDFNHAYTYENQEESWDDKIQFQGSDQAFAYGSGYVYPMINYGHDNTLESYDVTDMYPAFYEKELFDRIFKDAGFTYTSVFLNANSRFKRAIIPFTGLTFGLTEAQIADRLFNADTPVLIDSGIGLPQQSYLDFRYSNELSDPSNSYNNTTGVYTVSNNGIYNINANVQVYMQFIPTATIVPVKAIHYYKVYLVIRKNGIVQALNVVYVHPDFDTEIAPSTSYTTSSNPTYPSDEYSKIVNTSGVAVPQQLTIPNKLFTNLQQVYLSSGDTITTEIQVSKGYKTNGITYDYADENNEYSSGTANIYVTTGELKNSIVNTEVMVGDTIDMNQCVPRKVKQKDFVTSIFKKFNIFAMPNPDNPKDILLEPITDFYNDEVVDWSQKLDKSKTLDYIPMGKLNADNYIFKYKEDKDYYNQLYINSYSQTYGTQEVNIDNDFVNSDYETSLIFAPTPLVGQASNDRVVSTILKVDSQGQAVRTEGVIRSIIYDGLKDTNSTWTHNGNVKTQYPYAGHLDDPFTPSFDVNFGTPREIYYDNTWNTINLTDNNLYNEFYSQYIEEITDKDSKVVTGYFNLSPLDISNLDFRKQYYFDNAYFRIQKVFDYVPTNGNVTKCEFLKLKSKAPFEGITYQPNGGVPSSTSLTVQPPVLNVSNSKMVANNSYDFKQATVQGKSNIVDRTATSVLITGDNNVVGANSKNITITGNNNYVEAGLENVTIVSSDGVEVFESNTTYVNGKNVLADLYREVRSLADFTDPDSNFDIIYLEDGTSWNLLNDVDLEGNRIVCNGTVSIFSNSPEVATLSSTGLSGDIPLIKSEWTLALNNVGLEHGTPYYLDASINPNQSLDWNGVNFYDAGESVSYIKNYNNCVFNTIGFLNSGNFWFDGTFGTIAFTDTIFENTTGATSIKIEDTAIITRRLRIDNSSFVSLSGETALDVHVSASIPDEGYILKNVNFSGGGTYLSGVQSTDNKARFEGCRGIDNSGSVAQYYMSSNATATTVSTSGTDYKVLGTTTSGAYVEKFDVTTTDNKAVYEGSLTGFYKISVTASMSSGNNKVLSLSIGKNGTPTTSSKTLATSNAGGRAESITAHDVISLETTDYIEVFCSNETNTDNITVEDLNVVIERLN